MLPAAFPPEAAARVDALIQALTPKKGRRLAIVVNGYRHPDGKVDIEVEVDGEKFRHVVRLPVDSTPPIV